MDFTFQLICPSALAPFWMLPAQDRATMSGILASFDLFKKRAMRRMDRRQKLLGAIDPATSSGVEIGALSRPVVRKIDGPIFYVDYADAAFLKERYKNDPHVQVDDIVEVDGIWGKSTIAECLARIAPVDYVIASHVIEHVPDLITWLKELRSVLKSTGRVCLAVPDRRYSFDYHRSETNFTQVLGAYYFKARIPTVHQLLDHVLNLVPVDTGQLWNHAVPELTPNSEATLAGAMHLADDITKRNVYHDVHCWVFTPRSFSRIFMQLAQVGLCDYECEVFHDTHRNELEFFVTLRASDDRDQMMESWRQVYARARR